MVQDPVTGEEVRIDNCHGAHKLPVGACGDLDECDPREVDSGSELPVLIRSDFRHDPIEGCQGSYTKIIEEDCPKCGYDRAEHSVHTLAGVHTVTCRACEHTIEQG